MKAAPRFSLKTGAIRHAAVGIALSIVKVPVPNPACTPASGSTLPLGTTTVNCQASDDAGNSSRLHAPQQAQLVFERLRETFL